MAACPPGFPRASSSSSLRCRWIVDFEPLFPSSRRTASTDGYLPVAISFPRARITSDRWIPLLATGPPCGRRIARTRRGAPRPPISSLPLRYYVTFRASNAGRKRRNLTCDNSRDLNVFGRCRFRHRHRPCWLGYPSWFGNPAPAMRPGQAGGSKPGFRPHAGGEYIHLGDSPIRRADAVRQCQSLIE